MGHVVGFESHNNLTKLSSFANADSLLSDLGLKPFFLTRRLFVLKILAGQVGIGIN